MTMCTSFPNPRDKLTRTASFFLHYVASARTEFPAPTAECVAVQYWIYFFIALAKLDRTRTASFFSPFLASARTEFPAPNAECVAVQYWIYFFDNRWKIFST